MFSLTKIKLLKNFRFFQDYKWDENGLSLFQKYNIFYGWNGSGKSTLCDFLKRLENKEAFTEGEQFELHFRMEMSHQNT